jgi:hypothetical protein
LKHVQSFRTANDTESVIPSAALSVFPFKPEPLLSWGTDSDLSHYLQCLYDGTGYGHIARGYLEVAVTQFDQTARQFQLSAASSKPLPGVRIVPSAPPDFVTCPLFGLAAKSACAWDHLVGNLLSESSFFSLPHLLESQSDLFCSMRLAGDLYYRQAMMVLRCYIESVVLPMYFCVNPKDFQSWKEESFRTPPLRGAKGVLAKLRSQGLIGELIETRTSHLYENLNAYIHGSQNSLNNAGLLTGQWEGHIFREDAYQNWVRCFAEAIELVIHLARAHHDQWQRAEAENGRICRVCHGRSLALTKEAQAIRFTCEICGNSFHEDTEGKSVVLTAVDIVVD